MSRRPRRDDGPSQLSLPFSTAPEEPEIAVIDRRGECVADGEWRWDRDWHADLELQWERDWQIARDRQRRRVRARGEARPDEDRHDADRHDADRHDADRHDADRHDADRPQAWELDDREAEMHVETTEPEPEPYGEIRVSRRRREPRVEIAATEDWSPFDPLTEIAALDRRVEQAGGVPGRRTIEITGHAPDVYVPRQSRDSEWIAAERTERPRYESRSYRPDRTAMWAVVLGLLLMCAAAASAHAAVVSAIH